MYRIADSMRVEYTKYFFYFLIYKTAQSSDSRCKHQLRPIYTFVVHVMVISLIKKYTSSGYVITSLWGNIYSFVFVCENRYLYVQVGFHGFAFVCHISLWPIFLFGVVVHFFVYFFLGILQVWYVCIRGQFPVLTLNSIKKGPIQKGFWHMETLQIIFCPQDSFHKSFKVTYTFRRCSKNSILLIIYKFIKFINSARHHPIQTILFI